MSLAKKRKFIVKMKSSNIKLTKKIKKIYFSEIEKLTLPI